MNNQTKWSLTSQFLHLLNLYVIPTESYKINFLLIHCRFQLCKSRFISVIKDGKLVNQMLSHSEILPQSIHVFVFSWFTSWNFRLLLSNIQRTRLADMYWCGFSCCYCFCDVFLFLVQTSKTRENMGNR